MRLFDFLFGHKPKIFDSEGRVRHNLSEERWEAWQDRYKSDPEYNWKHHTGTKPTTKFKGFRRRPPAKP